MAISQDVVTHFKQRGADAFKSATSQMKREIEKLNKAIDLEHLKKTDKIYLQLTDDLKKMRGAARGTATGLEKMSQVALISGANLTTLAQGAKSAALAFVDMARSGEKGIAATAQFERMGGTAASLEKLRKATNGLVSDADLTRFSTMAKSFGIGEKNLETFAKSAVGASKKLGQSVDFMLESLITGVGRGSKELIDNTGVLLPSMKDMEEAYRAATGAAGPWNDTMKKAAVEMAAVVGSSDNLAAANVHSVSTIQKMDTAWTNFKDSFSQGLAKAADDVAKNFEIIEPIEQKTAKLVTSLDREIASLEGIKKALAAGGEEQEKYRQSLQMFANQTSQAQHDMDFYAKNLDLLEKTLGSAKLTQRDATGEIARVSLPLQAAAAATKRAAFWNRNFGDEIGFVNKMLENEAMRITRIKLGLDGLKREFVDGFSKLAGAEVERLKAVEAKEKAQKEASKRRRDLVKKAASSIENVAKISNKAQQEETRRHWLMLGFETLNGLENIKKTYFGFEGINGEQKGGLFEIFGLHSDPEDFAPFGDGVEAMFARVRRASAQVGRDIKAGYGEWVLAAEKVEAAEHAKNMAHVNASLGAAGAIAGAVTQFVGGEREKAGISGAMETAMAISAFVTPGMWAAGIGHAASAAAFFAIAGGAKKSGGASSGGGGAGRAQASVSRRAQRPEVGAIGSGDNGPQKTTNVQVFQFGSGSTGQALAAALNATVSRRSGVGLDPNLVKSGGRSEL